MSKRLRILSVCRSLPNPDDPSGGVFVLNRLRAMARSADLTVVQPIPYAPVVRPLPAWASTESRRQDDLEIRHAPMLYLPGVLKSADGMWLARSIDAIVERVHRETPLDAVDAHFGYPDGVGCATVAERLGLPYFVTVRGNETEYVTRPILGARMLKAMRGATGCIAVSHSLHELAARHGVSAERLRVIHNAVDTETFHYDDAAPARAAIGIEDSRPLVVSVGHLISRKRHHVLLDAFAELSREHPSALLAIVGARSFEPNYPDLLAAKSRELGIASRVRFVGNVAPRDVAVWLRAADVFALGTAREGCCNAVLEALGIGVPVVTTPAGDNAYFVKDATNGFIVPIDDAPALARGIDAALSRDWDRQEIARELFAKAGSWSGVSERVLEFIHERLAARAAEGERNALSAI